MNEPTATIQVPVTELVYKKTKAVTATITTALSVLTLFGTQIADGSLTWDEGGVLIGAVTGAIATVLAVWRVPNEVDGQRSVYGE